MLTDDDTPISHATDDHGDGVTYIEVLMLQHLCERDRALHIGRAMVTPLRAADADLGYGQRLHFYKTLVACVLEIARSRLDDTGRAAILQALRNAPAAADRAASWGLQ